MTAITITDLNNAKLDVDHISDFANAVVPTVTDRFGNEKLSIHGALVLIDLKIADVEAARVGAVFTTIPGLVAQVDEAVAATYVGQAQAAKQGAEAAQAIAQAARDAALAAATTAAISAGSFGTKALGNAAVANGAPFLVRPNTTDALSRFSVYLRVDATPGNATFVADFSTGSEMDAITLRSSSGTLVATKAPIYTSTRQLPAPAASLTAMVLSADGSRSGRVWATATGWFWDQDNTPIRTIWDLRKAGKKRMAWLPETGLVFSNSAGTTAATVNGAVANMTDKFASGTNPVQATATNQPKLRVDANGKRYIEFNNGDNDNFMRVDFAITQPWTRISLIRLRSWVNGARIFTANSNFGILEQAGVSPQLKIFSGTLTTFIDSLAAGDLGVVMETHNGALSLLRHDGGDVLTADAGTTEPNGFVVGARGTATDPSTLDWYGTFMLEGTLNDVEIQTAIDYLRESAGLSITALPDGGTLPVPTTAEIAGPTYSLTSQDWDATLRATGACAVSLPANLPTGFRARVMRDTAEEVIFTPGAGAAMVTPNDCDRISVQYGRAIVEVMDNPNDLAARWNVSGDVTKPLEVTLAGVSALVQGVAVDGYRAIGSGGVGMRYYRLQSGALPTGVTFSEVSGRFAGTPTVVGDSTGLVVRFYDETGAFAEYGPFSLHVLNPADTYLLLKSDLIASDTYEQLDHLQIVAGNTRTAAKQNVVNPGTFDLAEVGTAPTLDAVGFKSAAAGSYLTSINVATGNTKFLPASHTFGFWCMDDLDATTVSCGYGGSRINPRTSNQAQFKSSSTTQDAQTGEIDATGLQMVNRRTSAGYTYYHNGEIRKEQTRTSGAADNGLFRWCSWTDGATAQYDITRRQAVMFAGRAFDTDAQVLAFYRAIGAELTRRGTIAPSVVRVWAGAVTDTSFVVCADVRYAFASGLQTRLVVALASDPTYSAPVFSGDVRPVVWSGVHAPVKHTATGLTAGTDYIYKVEVF